MKRATAKSSIRLQRIRGGNRFDPIKTLFRDEEKIDKTEAASPPLNDKESKHREELRKKRKKKLDTLISQQAKNLFLGATTEHEQPKKTILFAQDEGYAYHLQAYRTSNLSAEHLEKIGRKLTNSFRDTGREDLDREEVVIDTDRVRLDERLDWLLNKPSSIYKFIAMCKA